MLLWRLAAFSIVRHGRRALLIVAAIAVAVVTMLFVGAMLEGMRLDFFNSMLDAAGHLRIRPAGWNAELDPLSLRTLIEDPRGLQTTVVDEFSRSRVVGEARTGEGAPVVEPVLTAGALLVNDRSNLRVVLTAAPPGARALEAARREVVAGSFDLVDGGASTSVAIGDSAAIGADDAPPPIAISVDAARVLEVELGGGITVLVEDRSGGPYYLDFVVRAIYTGSSAQFGPASAVVSQAVAGELYDTGSAARELRVFLARPEDAPPAAEVLRAAFGDGWEMATWQDLGGGTIVLLELFDVFMLMINGLIAVVAATVITNAVLMNAFERAAEYATLRAIGLTRRAQVALMLREGVVYGVAGSVAGIAFGAPLTRAVGRRGLDFGEAMVAFGLSARMHPVLTATEALWAAVFGVLIAVAATAYAAHVGARAPIVDALREE